MHRQELAPDIRAIVFDVGETLVDESRAWTAAAEAVGVPPFTLMGVLGALIERGEDHRHLWSSLGVERPDSRHHLENVDLYPDALSCLEAVSDAGFAVGIAGNQPEGIETQLKRLGFAPDFIASSAAWGVEKPSAAFFERVIRAAGLPAHEVLYVGDRLDNDILPARAAGLRTAFIRRGPWGFVHSGRPDARLADLRLSSLSELAAAAGRRSPLEQ